MPMIVTPESEEIQTLAEAVIRDTIGAKLGNLSALELARHIIRELAANGLEIVHA